MKTSCPELSSVMTLQISTRGFHRIHLTNARPNAKINSSVEHGESVLLRLLLVMLQVSVLLLLLVVALLLLLFKHLLLLKMLFLLAVLLLLLLLLLLCFTDLDQGSEISIRFSLPKSMKHSVVVLLFLLFLVFFIVSVYNYVSQKIF